MALLESGWKMMALWQLGHGSLATPPEYVINGFRRAGLLYACPAFNIRTYLNFWILFDAYLCACMQLLYNIKLKFGVVISMDIMFLI